ncbi:iron ABC transporter permease [Cohnella xylanilytica]|uniref:Iron ABC transporter permease n=1 Tax=Cohnella xylanilytica TaxID=557555 RepID=A0A841U3P8_9BACL|nr:iron ABC transporter permease [Cohnella xylanilytica]MBB6692943.1 iron ABC transporter permease [Cohnella xylanilytica]
MTANDFLRKAGRRRAARAWTLIAVLAVLVVVVFVVSMNSGFIRLSPLSVAKTLFGAGTDKEELILFELRLPRIVLSILIGAGLAISGCVLQGITRNPLADPGILGINSGAGLMIAIVVALYPELLGSSIFLLPCLALIGALATAALLYLLARKKGEGLSPTRLALVGIALASGISSAMIVLTMSLNPEQYQFVQNWLVGSITGTSWKFVLAFLPWVVVLVPFVLYKAKTLNVLSLGDSLATGLGMRTERERVALLVAAVALAGSCVAVGGGISFVGLVAPHLARHLVGSKHQALVPATALTGALLVLAADTVSRTSGMPTGIVVAVLGAPYFLYLLARARSR